MKKLFIGTFAAAFFCAILSASANPPNAIDGFYDVGRGELNITVQHMVNDPKTHFIKEVIVSKDGKEVAKKEFAFQTSHRNQTMPPFKLAAQPGESFKVKAECNIYGSREVSIDVKEGAENVRKLN